YGSFGAGFDRGSLMRSRQESRAPVSWTVRRNASRIGKNHERRQVLVQAAQAIADPSSRAGEPRQHETCVLHEGCWTVDVAFGLHGIDERHIVHAFCQMREQGADPSPALPVLLPLPWAGHDRARRALKKLDLAARIEFLPVTLYQLRFVVKCIALARRAGHE